MMSCGRVTALKILATLSYDTFLFFFMAVKRTLEDNMEQVVRIFTNTNTS